MRVQLLGLLSLAACGGPPETVDASVGADGSIAIDAALSDAAISDAAIDAPSADDASIDAAVDAGAPRMAILYVGQDDGNLVAHTIDAAGAITETSRVAAGGHPSFAAIAPSGLFLYAVDEARNEVISLSVAPGTGALTRLGSIASGSAGPTHLSVDRSGRWVLVAHYGGGTVTVLPVLAGGTVGAPVDVESPGANAHMIATDPTNRWALVPCLGTNRIEVFAFDEATGELSAAGGIATAAGAGPRHFAWGDATHVYVVDELDSTVGVYAFEPATGALSSLQTLSTLPAGFAGTNSGAEILFRGSFVYTSNRGHDSIAVFAVGADARLTAAGHAMLGAQTPRSMAIDPTGSFLVAGAQRSDVLVTFRIGSSLVRLGPTTVGAAPTFVGVFEIPGV